MDSGDFGKLEEAIERVSTVFVAVYSSTDFAAYFERSKR